jgi:hypothetical protein
MSLAGLKRTVLALLPNAEPLRESGEARVTRMPFRLDIVETGEQWVVTCTTPHGKAVNRIPALFSTDVLHRVLADIEKALIGSYSPVTTRRAAPVEQVVREFGQSLSDAVLTGDVRRLFDRCREDARERQTSLQILPDTDGPNVSVIPWEFTVDPNALDEYLARRVPIIHSPHFTGPVSSSRVALPLRVLGASARPADLPALDTQREREDISKAFCSVCHQATSTLNGCTKTGGPNLPKPCGLIHGMCCTSWAMAASIRKPAADTSSYREKTAWPGRYRRSTSPG